MRVGEYRVPPDIATRIFSGHPWVFRDALGARGVSEPTGGLVDLISGNREFVARGYVDREHQIAVRVLTRRRRRARRARQTASSRPASRAPCSCAGRCFGAVRPSAMRVFTGESEGLPGRHRGQVR